MVIPTKYNDSHGWADFVDRLIWVVKQTNQIHIVPIGAAVEPADVKWKNAALCYIDNVWLVYNRVFKYLLGCISITLECLIHVYSCEILYWIVLFNIDNTHYHIQRIQHLVHRNHLGDIGHRTSSYINSSTSAKCILVTGSLQQCLRECGV